MTLQTLPPPNIFADEMTLRDWFAGQALCGIMSRLPRSDYVAGVNSEDWSFTAGDAYAIADWMLSTRKENPGEETNA